MPVSRITDQVGRVVGSQYRLLAPLGTGSSAHVYLAEEVDTRRRVAVKVLHAALAGDDSFLRRFRVEAQAAAVLNHPHITKVFDWGEYEDGPYLVLEYLGGGSLRALLDDRQRLSPSQATSLGAQAAQALAYAHGRGLVHRDVKPGNLLFDEEGRIRISDFGLARALAEAAWTEPVGSLLGTARYASPEQAQGRPVDGRSDVYSLGLLLVEAVTGHVPFVADTTIATLMARVGSSLEPPEALGPLGAVVAAATAADPAKRLDAASLAGALNDLARVLPAPAPLLPVSAPSWLEPDSKRVMLGEGRPFASDGGVRTPLGDILDDDARLLPPEGDPLSGVGRVPVVDPGVSRLRRRGLLRSRTGRPERRWRRAAALGLVVLLGGSAYALFGARVLVASHALPVLRGLGPAQARAKLAPLHLSLEVTGRRYDPDVRAGGIVSQDPPAALLGQGRRHGRRRGLQGTQAGKRAQPRGHGRGERHRGPGPRRLQGGARPCLQRHGALGPRRVVEPQLGPAPSGDCCQPGGLRGAGPAGDAGHLGGRIAGRRGQPAQGDGPRPRHPGRLQRDDPGRKGVRHEPGPRPDGQPGPDGNGLRVAGA